MLFMAMRAAAALASSIPLGSVWPAASANTAAAISGLRVAKADATAFPSAAPASVRVRGNQLKVLVHEGGFRHGRLLRADEQEPRSLSFTKKAVAFFRMSCSICRRLFSRRSRTNSSRSAWLRAPGGPSPASISARRTHSRRAVSVRSKSLAVCAMLRPPARTSVTASALNSDVNCRLFLFVRSTSRRINAPSEVSTKAGEA